VLGVVLIDQKERHLVIRNQAADLLAVRERHVHAPEDLARALAALARVAARADVAVGLGARARGLGHVVQQRGQEHDRAFARGQRAPGRHLDQGLEHHAGVDPHVTLGVPHRALHAAAQRAHPVVRLVETVPVEPPRRRRRHEVDQTREMREMHDHDLRGRAGAKMSTSGARRFCTMGRSSQ
jgi:hypothetical protein